MGGRGAAKRTLDRGIARRKGGTETGRLISRAWRPTDGGRAARIEGRQQQTSKHLGGEYEKLTRNWHCRRTGAERLSSGA